MDSKKLAKNIRIDVLEMIHKSGASHIGSAYSVADILAVLYADILNYDIHDPKAITRDRLVLSKGHAGAALYAVLAEIGFFDKSLLDSYEANGSHFSGHISHKGVPGVEFSTGSLGHGVSVAAGLALAGKMNGEKYRVFAIVGDGETNEGSFWETILFAHQYKLSNFIVIIDRNNMQATGNTSDILDTGDLAKKINDFGWNVLVVDGHNHLEIKNSLNQHFNNDHPFCVVANTIKGKGVSFFENSLLWHYKDPQGSFYQEALKELLKEDENEK